MAAPTRPISARLDFADPRHADGARLRLAFGAPRQVLVAHAAHEVRAVLDAVQAQAEAGAWCVGYLRFEAAAAFDAAFLTHTSDAPLAWFGVYDEALPWNEAEMEVAGTAAEVEWVGGLERVPFEAALATIRREIAAGDYYQVNYTAQLHGLLRGGTEALFAALQRAQPGGYAAWLDTGAEQVLSVSPELFFDWQQGQLLTRPMKGTAARGATAAEDAALAQGLRDSPKERAENVMVVDLLRNDLSRIAQPHSVQVPRLFHTEALPTVWQMTSDVVARTRPGCTLADVFAALFPCGSVTGAPKVRALQAIRALEPEARGVYCGALGLLRPGGHATFNVPIRTLSVRGVRVRCGIGSGITAGSQAEGEWREWQAKQAFVQRASAPFALLETLALEVGVLRHGAAHCARLQAAARHFGYPWEPAALQASLDALLRQHPQGLWRVRLLLDAQGRFQAEASALEAPPAPLRLRLAQRPLAGVASEFIAFKTTRRAHYEAFAPQEADVFDTVLWNERGELTECTRGNIALELDGQWLTPALHCGLLGGIGRAQALQAGRVREAVVPVQEVARATRWAFVNSLRGWLDAELAL